MLVSEKGGNSRGIFSSVSKALIFVCMSFEGESMPHSMISIRLGAQIKPAQSRILNRN